jgi:hypothetical protein
VAESETADPLARATGEVRASLRPVDAHADDRPPSARELCDVDAEAAQPGLPGIGECHAAALVEQPLARHRLGHGDAESPGEVVVARASPCERVRGGHGAKRARLLRPGLEVPHQILEQVGHARIGELDVAVAPLPPLDQQPARHEPVEVLARGRACNPRVPRKLPGRPGTAVEERQAERSTRIVGKQAGEPRQRIALGAGNHALHCAGRRFGQDRTVVRLR